MGCAASHTGYTKFGRFHAVKGSAEYAVWHGGGIFLL
jgi:hypothetical protein